MLFKSIQIQNLLSYGPDTGPLELRPLNVLIGANGSGKSNLLEVIGLLKAAPENLSAPVKEAGGVHEWLHQPSGGGKAADIEAMIEVVVDTPNSAANLRHMLLFTEHGQRFEVIDETVAYERAQPGQQEASFFYKFQRGHPVLNEFIGEKEQRRKLRKEEILPEQSILSQIKDPNRYPELGHLRRQYLQISMMRDWVFGRYTPPRQEQKLGMPNDFLSDTCDNLPLVLAGILPEIEENLVEQLKALYPRISSVHTKPSGDRLQLYFKEGRRLIPATRLSDGTLRYLCLLTVLLHPAPPPLVCIDEPELGLHPDILPSLADLLIESSSRMQLVVTTHSDLLIDALQEQPESVITVEAAPQGTQLNRLNAQELAKWLEKYSLGELWTRGEIGGARW